MLSLQNVFINLVFILLSIIMETNDVLEQKSQVLEVTENSKMYLKTAASWTNFYAIIGFVAIAFLFLAGFIMMTTGNVLSGFGIGTSLKGLSTVIGLFYIALAVIMVFPMLSLFRFSQNTNNALKNCDVPAMEKALKNMKAYWRFTGIMTIVSIALIIIIIPVMIVVSMSLAGLSA